MTSGVLVGGAGVLEARLGVCGVAKGAPSSQACPTGSLSPKSGVAALPEPKGLLEIGVDTLGQALPSSKSEGALPVCMNISVDGKSVGAYGTIAVQGSSTAGWPKKNWSLKLYSDKARKQKILLKVGNSIASDTWVAKAEWIDPTQLRNPLSYRLWGQMTSARSTSPKLEVQNSKGPHNPGA